MLVFLFDGMNENVIRFHSFGLVENQIRAIAVVFPVALVLRNQPVLHSNMFGAAALLPYVT